MSVVIKGIQMPRMCLECPLCYCVSKTIRECSITKKKFRLYHQNGSATRMKDCPLIELPEKHGRLIDSDKLFDKLTSDKRETFTKHDVWLMLMPYGSPTVLEAEE